MIPSRCFSPGLGRAFSVGCPNVRWTLGTMCEMTHLILVPSGRAKQVRIFLLSVCRELEAPFLDSTRRISTQVKHELIHSLPRIFRRSLRLSEAGYSQPVNNSSSTYSPLDSQSILQLRIQQMCPNTNRSRRLSEYGKKHQSADCGGPRCRS